MRTIPPSKTSILSALEKLAEERTRVKAHVRVVNGKTALVRTHDRHIDSEPVPAKATSSSSDMELWLRWKEGGKKEQDLLPLMKAFDRMVYSHANTYTGKVRIPEEAILLRYRTELVGALDSYDPSRGASLSTWVYQYLNRTKRWISQNQNIGRIPENRIYKIREFQDAATELAESMGQRPTDKQLADKLGWSLAETTRMRDELRNDLTAQNFEGDTFVHVPSRNETTLRLFKEELDGKDRILYEHLTGYGRKHITSTSELAKILGEEPYRVSRRKEAIAKRLKGRLDARE